MRLPSFLRLNKGDYSQDQQDLIGKLAASLNISIQVIYDALNGKTNLTDNIDCKVADVTLAVDSSGNPISSTTFIINNNSTVRGLSLIKAQNITNTNIYPTSSPFISFTQINNTVRIDNISGLQANNQYTLRIIAWN